MIPNQPEQSHQITDGVTLGHAQLQLFQGKPSFAKHTDLNDFYL